MTLFENDDWGSKRRDQIIIRELHATQDKGEQGAVFDTVNELFRHIDAVKNRFVRNKDKLSALINISNIRIPYTVDFLKYVCTKNAFLGMGHHYSPELRARAQLLLGLLPATQKDITSHESRIREHPFHDSDEDNPQNYQTAEGYDWLR